MNKIDESIKKAFSTLGEIKSHSKGLTGIPTGFKDLDIITGGLQNGDLISIVGEASNTLMEGKTSLALNIALNAAKSHFIVAIFSLEMSEFNLTLRLLSLISNIPLQNIRNATISSKEWLELTDSAAKLADFNIYIENNKYDLNDIINQIKKLKEEEKIQVVIIDYLQLIVNGSKIYSSRLDEVLEIVRKLRIAAKDMNIPIILISDIYKTIKRESDIVLQLFKQLSADKKGYYSPEVYLEINKQRNGPSGLIKLFYIKELCKFEDL